MMAIVSMILLTFIITEISYETSVDYVIASQQVQRIQARYAAKSGVELSLLRIQLYKQAMAAFGEALGPNKSMLDPIWKFPFMWPPTLDGKMTGVDEELIKSTVKESLMQAQYATTITPEGGALDINDLGSDIKTLKEATMKQLLQIFENETQLNDDFRTKHSNVRFDELVNNIADYIDEDSEGLNGSDEASPYRDIKDEKLPPNRALRTLDELHQVAGMKDEFYELLAPRVTVYGTKGINVNYAPKEMLMALDPQITEEVVSKIIQRRDDQKLGGPFVDDNDFFGFLQPYGVNSNEIKKRVPLLYDMEYNFRVVSTGIAGNVKREITAVLFDYANIAQRLAELKAKQEEQDQGGGSGAGSGGQAGIGTSSPGGATGEPTKPKIQLTKGRPNVVYWEEN
jgi:general secretion pathway protein K